MYQRNGFTTNSNSPCRYEKDEIKGEMFNNSWQAIYIQQIKLKCVFLGKKIDVSFS